MKLYFSTQWESKLDGFDKIEDCYKEEDGELFVFCSFENRPDVEGIKLKIMIKGKNVESKKYEVNKKLGDCGFIKIDNDNKEFPAIQAVWHGLDRAYETITNSNVDVGVRKIYVFGSNDQMMRRIAGCYFGLSRERC